MVDPSERKRSSTRAAKRQQAIEKLGGDDADGDAPDAPGGPRALPEHRVKHRPDGGPHDKAQRTFTDAESRIMVEDGDHYIQAYNAQAVVDAEAQIIVAHGVGNQAADTHYLPGMVDRAIGAAGAAGVKLPTDSKLVADAGYWAPGNVRHAEAAGLDPHISVERVRHGAGRRPRTVLRPRRTFAR